MRLRAMEKIDDSHETERSLGTPAKRLICVDATILLGPTSVEGGDATCRASCHARTKDRRPSLRPYFGRFRLAGRGLAGRMGSENRGTGLAGAKGRRDAWNISAGRE